MSSHRTKQRKQVGHTNPMLIPPGLGMHTSSSLTTLRNQAGVQVTTHRDQTHEQVGGQANQGKLTTK